MKVGLFPIEPWKLLLQKAKGQGVLGANHNAEQFDIQSPRVISISVPGPLGAVVNDTKTNAQSETASLPYFERVSLTSKKRRSHSHATVALALALRVQVRKCEVYTPSYYHASYKTRILYRCVLCTHRARF